LPVWDSIQIDQPTKRPGVLSPFAQNKEIEIEEYS